jgi:hypothetical protein
MYPLLAAKRAQIEAGRGRPLTVCIGRFVHRLPEGLAEEVGAYEKLEENRRATNPESKPIESVLRLGFSTYGDGCGDIIEDSRSFARPSFQAYCTGCHKRSTARMKSRIGAIRDFWLETSSSFVVHDERGRPVRRHRKHCSCGLWFWTTTPQQRRCRPSCRGGSLTKPGQTAG